MIDNKLNFLNKIPNNLPYKVIGEYINATTPILVRTKYGDCLSYPCNIIRGNQPKISTALNKEEFIIKRFKEIHGSIYNYNKLVYKNTNNKVIVSCKEHGDYEITPHNHLAGLGCLKCCRKRQHLNEIEKFINNSKRKHKNKYSYDRVDYRNSKEKVIINCPEHGDFLQEPNSHVNGKGCPECSLQIKGFSRSSFIKSAKGEKCIFYIIKCFNENEEFYKFGITKHSTEYRYSNKKLMPYNYKVIAEVYNEASKIFDIEQIYKKQKREFKYKPNLSFDGKTECYKE